MMSAEQDKFHKVTWKLQELSREELQFQANEWWRPQREQVMEDRNVMASLKLAKKGIFTLG